MGLPIQTKEKLSNLLIFPSLINKHILDADSRLTTARMTRGHLLHSGTSATHTQLPAFISCLEYCHSLWAPASALGPSYHTPSACSQLSSQSE